MFSVLSKNWWALLPLAPINSENGYTFLTGFFFFLVRFYLFDPVALALRISTVFFHQLSLTDQVYAAARLRWA